MKNSIAEFWSTAAYAGRVPKAPGTAGAAAGVLLAYLLYQYAGWSGWMLALLAVVLLLPSVWAANVLIAATKSKDPQIIVMDEVLGQLLAFAGAPTLEPGTYVAAFLLFRFFDIAKPYPVKRLEVLPDGWGVMMDDLMAGVYAAMVMWGLRSFAGLPV